MARPSRVTVLAEDRRQQQLIFRYLRRVGLEIHAIRLVPLSAGSGEQRVREQFPKELSEYRSRNTRAATRLIAVTDADVFSVEERLAQLDRRLREDGVDPIRMDTDQIARLIPKRNIETWLSCLNGNAVGEGEVDYKRTRHDWDDLIQPAADTLYAWTRPNAQIPDLCVPSLRHAIGELRRLDLSDV